MLNGRYNILHITIAGSTRLRLLPSNVNKTSCSIAAMLLKAMMRAISNRNRYQVYTKEHPFEPKAGVAPNDSSCFALHLYWARTREAISPLASLTWAAGALMRLAQFICCMHMLPKSTNS